MRWKIYYDDGTTFSDEDGSLEDAPARGVQAIVCKDERLGWVVETGCDYYVWKDGRFYARDIFGLFDFLIDSGLVKFGRTITSMEYNQVFQRALEDAAFARKGGYDRRERKP